MEWMIREPTYFFGMVADLMIGDMHAGFRQWHSTKENALFSVSY